MKRYRVMCLSHGWTRHSTLDDAIESAMFRARTDHSRRFVIYDDSKDEPEQVAYAFRGYLYDPLGNDYKKDSVRQYLDKNGNEILPGMKIRLDDGTVELVHRTCDDAWNEDLGISASNEEYLKRHPDADREYYSLSNWRADSIEIVEG